jgi:hypothetical protein
MERIRISVEAPLRVLSAFPRFHGRFHAVLTVKKVDSRKFGRFKAFPIEHDDHLRTVLRYVESYGSGPVPDFYGRSSGGLTPSPGRKMKSA